jgi:hypothetical protein
VVFVAIASLLTMAQLLLEIKAAYNAVANISTINITYIEKLVKGFAEGSIHAELATMLLSNTIDTSIDTS